MPKGVVAHVWVVFWETVCVNLVEVSQLSQETVVMVRIAKLRAVVIFIS